MLLGTRNFDLDPKDFSGVKRFTSVFSNNIFSPSEYLLEQFERDLEAKR